MGYDPGALKLLRPLAEPPAVDDGAMLRFNGVHTREHDIEPILARPLKATADGVAPVLERQSPFVP